MIDKIGRELIIENGEKRNLITSIFCSLDCTAPYPDCSDIRGTKETQKFFITEGYYSVKYKPGSTYLSMARPYLIRCDLWEENGGYVRVKSWEHLVEEAQTKPKMRFLLEFSLVSEEYFKIAFENPYTPIFFAFDVLKYDKAVKARYKAETGQDLKWGSLVDPKLVLAEEARHEYRRERRKIDGKIRRKYDLR